MADAKTSSPAERLSSRFIDGFQVFGGLTEDNFRSALNYKPGPDDVFVATYPKCGTTWVQHILMLIFRQGEPLASQAEFFQATPYFEMGGSACVETMPRPGAIKTHLPHHLIPKSEVAKYVYVSRNPKDCCVSYYHHMKDLTPFHHFRGDFDEFFEYFLTGNVDYGDYFDHLLGWYAHRNDPNVLFVTYEELKSDPKAAVLRIASFIDDKLYAEPLRKDPETLDKVLKHSSFEYMKGAFQKGMADLFSMPMEELLKSGLLPPAMIELFQKMPSLPPGAEMPKMGDFIRKGVVGDWKNYFTEEQSERLAKKFSERTAGTDIPDLWREYM